LFGAKRTSSEQTRRADSSSLAQPSNRAAPIAAPCTGSGMSSNAIGGPACRMSLSSSSGMTVFAATTSTSVGCAEMIF